MGMDTMLVQSCVQVCPQYYLAFGCDLFGPAPKGHEKIMEQGAVEGLELAEEVMMAMAEHAEK